MLGILFPKAPTSEHKNINSLSVLQLTKFAAQQVAQDSWSATQVETSLNGTRVCASVHVCLRMKLVSSLSVLVWLLRTVSFFHPVHKACSQGFGVLHSLLPASLFEHLSIGRTTHPTTQWTTPLRGPCSDAHIRQVTTACVSSPRGLGCLHKLAHAAGHGHFFGASTTRRTSPYFDCSPKKP